MATHARRQRMTARLGALAILMAACGSTVQVVPAESGDLALDPSALGEDSLTAPVTDAPTPTPENLPAPVAVEPAAPPPGATGDAPRGTSTSPGTPDPSQPASNPVPDPGSDPATGPAPTTTPPSGPESGQGFDAREVYIGVPTQKDVNETARNLGLEGIDTGDQEANAQAMADYLNARGGILGRTVVVVFKDNSSADLSADGHRVAQANCSHFTEDRPVFAVINGIVQMMDELADCLTKRETVMVRIGNMYDQEVESRHDPYIYAMQSAKSEQFLPVMVDRLAAQEYFSPWDTLTGQPGAAPVKVGLLWNDWPITNRTFALLKQILEARGIEVAAEVAYRDPPQGDIESAQLRFASEGVTHVFVDYGFAMLQFMNVAESQRYRPRYALQTFQAPNLVEANAPADQLRGALGVGFNPHLDVSAPQSPGDVSPAAAECRKIFEDAGLAYSRHGTAEMFSFAMCDAFRLLADTLNHAGAFSAPQMRQGLGTVGPGFVSAGTFRTGFSGSRTDQAGAVLDLGWADDCSCLQYRSSDLHAIQ